MQQEQKQHKHKPDNSASLSLPENYQFNLSDFALFLSVMKIKDAYTDVLSIILNEPDLELREVKAEQVILNKHGKRAIRLDAWALDTRNRQFDMEMQNDTSSDDMRMRSRFYQGMIDTPILKAGKETRYKNLPSTIIIFITQDDIFGKDLAMYTFSEQCEEVMQSEEWEAVKMNILEIGIQKGIEQGSAETLIKNVESAMKNFGIDLQKACEGLGTTVEEYQAAKEQKKK